MQNNDQQRQLFSYSDFMAMVRADRTDKAKRHVEEVEIKGREYNFTAKSADSKAPIERGVAIGPEQADTKELLDHGVKFTFHKDNESPILASALTILLPMLFLLVM